MSFETVTMYRLVCDGCGFDREPVEEDAREPDIAEATDFDDWNEMHGARGHRQEGGQGRHR